MQDRKNLIVWQFLSFRTLRYSILKIVNTVVELVKILFDFFSKNHFSENFEKISKNLKRLE